VNFEGHAGRECTEHRTVGEHRAWCHDDHEWCYPQAPCRGCELPQLRAENERLRGIIWLCCAPVADALEKEKERARDE